jgi:hypothetical protein
MTAYGILLVDTSWANHDSVEIDKTTRLRHKDRLIAGTKALIYVREPIDAIVAEAEIAGNFIETETEPPDPAFNPAIPANLRLEHEIDRIETETGSERQPTAMVGNPVMANTYRVPLKVVRLKGHTSPIPFTRLQVILGSDFSVYDETWIPLSEDQYGEIVALWNTSTV